MDKEISIEQIKSGDDNAFKNLVDQYQEKVVNLCYSFTHNKEEALDLSQDIKKKIFHSIHSFREDASLSTWIYRITVNTSLNYVKKKKRWNWWNSLDEVFQSQNGEMQQDYPADDDLPGEGMEREEQYRQLYAAIDSLPEKQRIALTLNKFEEMPYKEIARVMHLNTSEVGVLINRARKKLQKKLIAKS